MVICQRIMMVVRIAKVPWFEDAVVNKRVMYCLWIDLELVVKSEELSLQCSRVFKNVDRVTEYGVDVLKKVVDVIVFS